MTYDDWKLASPPEYEEDAPPAQPQRSPEELKARESEAYWIGRARGLNDAADVLAGCPHKHCQDQTRAMRELAEHLATPEGAKDFMKEDEDVAF